MAANNFTLNIGEWQFSIKDLGIPMNEQFQKLYNYYFSGKGFEHSRFQSDSLNFFNHNNSSNDLDSYFNNFTPLWQFLLQQGSFFYAEQLWEIAVSISKKWEQQNQNRKIYKGAGYYFWAVTCILKEDLEKGFLLMHQALEEDRKNVNPTNIQSSPAYSFVILDYEQQNQFFRKKVLEMAKFVEQKLNNYQTSRNGKLTMAEFKVKFLQNPDLIELVFLFVFELFHVKKLLSENLQGLTQNIYGSMLMVQSIFTFSLLIDNIIKNKYNIQDPNKQQQQFMDLLIFLSGKANLKLDKSKMQEIINKMSTHDFHQTLDYLLNLHPVFKPKLQAIEEDISIIYSFRNSAAHKIKDRPYIHGNFNEIVNRLFNVFFLAVEKLY
jgi:hypothetical protein